jgi:hypothetical protein
MYLLDLKPRRSALEGLPQLMLWTAPPPAVGAIKVGAVRCSLWRWEPMQAVSTVGLGDAGGQVIEIARVHRLGEELLRVISPSAAVSQMQSPLCASDPYDLAWFAAVRPLHIAAATAHIRSGACDKADARSV